MFRPLAQGPGRRRGTVVPLLGRVVRRFEAATHERRGGLDILHLVGSPYDMGRQHGHLLHDEIREGIFDYYLCCLSRVVERSQFKKTTGFLQFIAHTFRREFFARFIRDRMLRHIPPAMQEEAQGLAEGAQIAFEQALRSAIVADVLLYLLGRMFRRQGSVAPSQVATMCTSIAAWGAATSNGCVLHGRNLEFWGVGKWDAHPVALVCTPERGLRYLSVSTAGFGTGGVTSMNEAGLTLALNIVPSRDVSLDGTPIVAFGNEIIRRAETIADAVKIASEMHATCGFALTLSEAKGRRAAVLEMSAGRQTLRETPSDSIVQTNHYVHPDMAPLGIEVNSSVRLHTIGRYLRAQQLLARDRGSIDEGRMTTYLGDHIDPFTGRERAVGNTIAQVNNLSSVVFAPERREAWIAVGPAPVAHNRFYSLRLDEELGESPRSEVLPYREGNGFARGERNEALRKYMEAYVRFEERGDAVEVLPFLEEALRLDPEEPSYALVCGVLRLKARRFPEAVAVLEQAIAREDMPHKRAVARFWKGMAHRFMGEAEAAAREFDQIRTAEGVGRDLHDAVDNHQFGIESVEDLSALDVDFVFTDVFRAE